MASPLDPVCLGGINVHQGTRIFCYVGLGAYALLTLIDFIIVPTFMAGDIVCLCVYFVLSAVLVMLLIGNLKEIPMLYWPHLFVTPIITLALMVIFLSTIALLAYYSVANENLSPLFNTFSFSLSTYVVLPLIGLLSLALLFVFGYFGLHVVNESRLLLEQESDLQSKMSVNYHWSMI